MLPLRQFQARLLEIALLSLLKASGYNTIAQPCPPMVEAGKNGLEVPGRSAYHQIDGIADFFISPPLSHPHRLLVEGKFYSDSVGIEVIRNAVGVLEDVSTYWTPVPSAPPTAPIHYTRWKQLLSLRRYHYQYAVVSATPFTVPAEAYAFGHDVYLFPLEGASYFQPVIDAIQAMTVDAFEAQSSERINVDMKQLHQALLSRIHLSDEKDILPLHVPLAASHLLENFCQVCQKIKIAIIATIGEQFPLIFIPDPKRVNEQVRTLLASERKRGETVQFRRSPQPQSKGWFLHYQGEQLFSFDFPERLFRLCADQDALTWTTNSQGETSLRLQTTLVNLRDSLGGDFDNQVHQIELEMTREAFENMRSQLNKSPKSR